ncbi:MAG: hypothetical protein IJ723_07635 [Ruminococcus sp.]|nr:hypothetical protein [Ruminococcus sp.]
MNKRILCCAAALMLAAGGINALPPAVTDITVSAYKKGDFTMDDKYVKKYNGFTYVVWNDDYQGDPDLYDDPDFSVGKGVVEILDYKVSGDSIEFPDKIKGLPVGFIDPNPLWNSKVKKIKLPKSIYFFYDHQNSEGGVYEYGRMAP